MKRSLIILSIIIFGLAMFVISYNGKEITGESYKQNAEPQGAVVHSGEHGTVTWEIYENGHLLFKPTNGVEGTFDDIRAGRYSPIIPNFHEFKEEVVSVSIEGKINSNNKLTGLFYGFSNVKTINLTNLHTENATEMASMFHGLSSLIELELGDSFDTSNVTDMSGMFEYLKKMVHINLKDKFNTSRVTDMDHMFANMEKLEILSLPEEFNTSRVEDMRGMFEDMFSLRELELGNNFDTAKVINMSNMFTNMDKIKELDLGDKYDTSNVETMDHMFGVDYYMNRGYSGMRSLENLRLGDKFDTSKVRTIHYMFAGMESIKELDLGDKFDTSNVSNVNGMTAMFSGMESLKKLDLGDKFDTSDVYTMEHMFGGARYYINDTYKLKPLRSLISLDLGDKFDTSKVSDFTGMFDGMSSIERLELGDKFKFNHPEGISILGMFYGMESLNTLKLPEGINSEKNFWMAGAFKNANNIKELELPSEFLFKILERDEIEEYYGTIYPGLVTPYGEAYTGKWIKKDGSAGPYTVEELYTNPDNLAGTWIWQEKEKITISKEFKFEGGYSELPNEIQIKLYKDGEETDEVITVDKSAIDSETGIVNVDFGEHYKYSDKAETNEIEYSAKIVGEIPNFNKVTETHYKYASPLMNITIEKLWVGGDEKIPDIIKVMLIRNGEDYREIELTKENNWELLVEGLEQKDINAEDYTYTLREITAVEYFTGVVENFKITNTYASPLTDIELSVNIPKDYDGEVTVTLMRGDEKTEHKVTLTADELREAGNKVVFKDQVRTDSKGVDYKYTASVMIEENEEVEQEENNNSNNQGTTSVENNNGNSNVNKPGKLPYAGASKNFIVGIMLAIVILYSRNNLRRGSARNTLRKATKNSFRK